MNKSKTSGRHRSRAWERLGQGLRKHKPALCCDLISSMDSQLGCWQAWEFPSSSGALNRTKGFSWKLGFQWGRMGQRRAKGQELLPGAFALRGARVSTLGPASLNRVS